MRTVKLTDPIKSIGCIIEKNMKMPYWSKEEKNAYLLCIIVSLEKEHNIVGRPLTLS